MEEGLSSIEKSWSIKQTWTLELQNTVYWTGKPYKITHKVIIIQFSTTIHLNNFVKIIPNYKFLSEWESYHKGEGQKFYLKSKGFIFSAFLQLFSYLWIKRKRTPLFVLIFHSQIKLHKNEVNFSLKAECCKTIALVKKMVGPKIVQNFFFDDVNGFCSVGLQRLAAVPTCAVARLLSEPSTEAFCRGGIGWTHLCCDQWWKPNQ